MILTSNRYKKDKKAKLPMKKNEILGLKFCLFEYLVKQSGGGDIYFSHTSTCQSHHVTARDLNLGSGFSTHLEL